MSTGPALTGWLIVEGGGEGDSPTGCPLRADAEGAPNTLVVLGEGLDGPGLRFAVAAGDGDGDGSGAVEFGDFEVLGRQPGRLVGRFTARAGAAPGRLTLAVTVSDGANSTSHHGAVECRFGPAATAVLGLNLNYATDPPGQLQCGLGSSAAEPNVVTLTGTDFTSDMSFSLRCLEDSNYHFNPVAPPVYVDSGTLRGTFQVYYDDSPPEIVPPNPITIMVTVTKPGLPPTKSPKKSFSSIQVVFG